jgi:hypothetical protein
VASSASKFEMLLIFLVDVFLSVFLIVPFSGAQTITSPCPQVFSYEYDFTQRAWYGEIRAHPPYGLFRIELSLVVAATITNVSKL